MSVTMPRCETCQKDFPNLRKCEFCGKGFCEDDFLKHMAYERRHEYLAEDQSKLWKKKRQSVGSG